MVQKKPNIEIEDNLILQMVEDGFTYDEIVKKLKITRTRIYIAKTRLNRKIKDVRKFNKMIVEVRKEKVIQKFGITEEQFEIIRNNLRKKRSLLAIETNLEKYKLNEILHFLKE